MKVYPDSYFILYIFDMFPHIFSLVSLTFLQMESKIDKMILNLKSSMFQHKCRFYGNVLLVNWTYRIVYIVKPYKEI